MKGINSIIDKVISVLSGISDMAVKVVSVYKVQIMDMPLAEPMITVGLQTLDADLRKNMLYAGDKNGTGLYSVPVDVAVSANVYLPHTASGFFNYNVLTYMIEALLGSSLTITKIEAGKMHYNSTFLCTVLPVTIHLHDRICGDSEGGY